MGAIFLSFQLVYTNIVRTFANDKQKRILHNEFL